MSTDPYAAPTADLDTGMAPIQTSIWSAKGRLSALSYFAQAMVATVVFMILAALLVFIAGLVLGGGDFGNIASGLDSGPGQTIFIAILAPLIIVMYYITWCMLIKRLHDRNHNGWWSLLILIPIVNIFFSFYALLFPGNKTVNRYGTPRMTKGWEKVVGIIALVFIVGAVALAIIGSLAGGV